MDIFEYSENKKWFALYTKSKHEFKAAAQLNECEIEYYLPTVVRIKQWSDRKKKVTEPLFSGYIFLHGSEKERLIALEQYAIVRTNPAQNTMTKPMPSTIPVRAAINVIPSITGVPQIIAVQAFSNLGAARPLERRFEK